MMDEENCSRGLKACYSDDDSLKKGLKSEDNTECETISSSSSHSSDDTEARHLSLSRDIVLRRRDCQKDLTDSNYVSFITDVSFSFESESTIDSPQRKNLVHVTRRNVGKYNYHLLGIITILILYICQERIYGTIWEKRIWPAQKRRIRREIRRFHVDQIAGTQQLAGGHAIQENSNMFTILLQPNVPSPRWDIVRSSLDAHANCPHVQQIVIDDAPDYIYEHASGKVTSTIASKQFLPSILMLSGDSVFTCDELSRGFDLWKKYPGRMVGFYPYRSHKGILENVSPGQGLYSFISNRAAFVHRAYLEHSKLPDDKMCQRLALSVRISAISETPPLAVMANPFEMSTTVEQASPQTYTCLSKLFSTYQIPTIPVESRTYLAHS